MMNDVLFPIGILIAITFWMAVKYALAQHQVEKQKRIAVEGQVCTGKVVAIQRPFMLDDCTRLYFDFVPEGMERPLRGCHVDRRNPDEARRALPVTGAVVTVRYLPQRPWDAVIGKLVTQ